mmetsp:Transcript_27553/g.64213  ORF Transcript_27553/g.64213 Transcript_27553/m.64213 type:complete len:521 (-) Transcript_27553:8-1570(-)
MTCGMARRASTFGVALSSSHKAAMAVHRAHHVHKLLEIDLPITVLVDFIQKICNVFLCDSCNSSVAQNLRQFLFANGARAVLVKHPEGSPTNILGNVVFPIEGSGQELCIVDGAAAVAVDVLNDLVQLWGYFFHASLVHAFLQLLHREEAVTILVHGDESLAQILDLCITHLTGDDVERSLLQLVLGPEALQVVHQPRADRHVGRSRGSFAHPLVVQRLFSCIPIFRAHLQKAPDQPFGILGDVLPVRRVETKLPLGHLSQDFLVCVAPEGRVAAEKHVHDDAAAPKISRLVVLPFQHLWSNVERRASFGGHRYVLLKLERQPEVNDLQVGLLYWLFGGKEEILRLQVPVAEAVLVHVVYRTKHLLHHHGGLHLGEVPKLDDSIEQLAAGAKLHDQVHLHLVLEGLVQLDDVRVVHDCHDPDFFLELLDVLHLRLAQSFDGPFLLRRLVDADANGSIGAFANLLLVHVIGLLDLCTAVVYDNDVAVRLVLVFALFATLLASASFRRLFFLGASAAHGSLT